MNSVEKLKNGFSFMQKNYFQSIGWFFEPAYWWVRHLAFSFYRYLDVILAQLELIDAFEISLIEFVFINLIPDLLLFYVLLWFIIPYFLLRKKVPEFIVLSIFAILTYSLLTFSIADVLGQNHSIGESPFSMFFSYDFLDAVQFWLMVTGLRLFFEYINTQKRLQALQQANFETEMAFLKSQISPHFLFNTLNNIATLIESRPEQANATVIQLSNVLRYQLYESQKKHVLLKKEIENLKNYLLLEKIRMNKPQIQFEVNESVESYSLPPLLFLPFVENAVKHGILEDGTVHLDIKFDKTRSGISFSIKNKTPTQKAEHAEGGIGLVNIKRRLNLLFTENHQLDIIEEDGWYVVYLELSLE